MNIPFILDVKKEFTLSKVKTKLTKFLSNNQYIERVLHVLQDTFFSFSRKVIEVTISLIIIIFVFSITPWTLLV